MTTTSHTQSVFRRSRGIRPARTTEDLPLPEAPTTATRLLFSTAVSRMPVKASRPQKNGWSSSRNGRRPRYGTHGRDGRGKLIPQFRIQRFTAHGRGKDLDRLGRRAVA